MNKAFYNYFNDTIKAQSVSEISSFTLQRILRSIPLDLKKKFPALLEELVLEIQKEFCDSGKMSAGIFIQFHALKDLKFTKCISISSLYS